MFDSDVADHKSGLRSKLAIAHTKPTIPALLTLLVLSAFASSAAADSWSAGVGTNSTSWHISRQSVDIDFNYSSSVTGVIAPEEYHGRLLKPYHSSYTDISVNDVQLRERTSAIDGSYSADDSIRLWSNDDTDLSSQITKPAGTDVTKFSYYEQWPVILATSRMLNYSGQQINELEFEGNGGDSVSSKLLYNTELTKDREAVMWLDHMNATVYATDDAVLMAEFKPTKYFGYLIRAQTSGLSDLGYVSRGPRYDFEKNEYSIQSESDERYWGSFYIGRRIEMNSQFEDRNATESWLF